ncbi:MAG: aminotransferase class III-fold pyridoxal phosphate-dependent enzyme [Actinobacteria bacterium]|nr:aminotransferase class III-fold pyridoxal phosphate-dependent enzyme [Actinomycetota bacterium]
MTDITAPSYESGLEVLTEHIHEAYTDRSPDSAEWHRRASQSLIAGVTGTVRYFAPFPLYFAGGQGSRAVDIDGNDYIDCFLCGATLLLGHRPPDVEEAIRANLETGSLILNPKLATEVAEQLQKMIPAAERVRLVNSGTEAVMTAMRFARAFTGRSKIIKFHGTYHGMSDQVLSGLDRRGHRLGAGIPSETVSQTIGCDFDNLDQVAELLAGGDIAAMLVDPTMHHAGLFVGAKEHYEALRDLAHEAGALLIFDEVISGFRIAAGGAQEYFGVVPDLAVFAKALAVGEKLGAIVGRADIMAVADPSRTTPGPFAFQSGTCSDSTSAQTSALAAMRGYEKLGIDGGYNKIDALAKRLGEGLQQQFTDRGFACQFTQLGPMVRLFLTDGPLSYAHCERLDRRPIDLFHLGLITEGVLTIPGSNDFFLSFAHTVADIDEIVAAAGRVLDSYNFVDVMAPTTTPDGAKT